tara:strand:- start:1496 stop:2371 length:876 start_codon:yes stop_codon:yes gene_type:complete
MVVKRKTKPKRKVKKKQPTQKQKQTQRQSVTVNINTKGQTKRKAPRASANSNTSRVLQQFAQPLITLPSNLINPPSMPQYGLNRINQGLTGNVIGEDLALRERLKAGLDKGLAERERLRAGLNARQNDEQSLSGFSTISGSADYIPEYGMSGDGFPDYLKSMSSPSATGLTNFSVSSSVPPPPPAGSFLSPPVFSEATRRPARRRRTQVAEGAENIMSFARNPSGLSAEPPQDVGIPMAGNPALKTGLDMKFDKFPKMPSVPQFLPRRPSSDFGAGTIPMADIDSRSYSSY